MHPLLTLCTVSGMGSGRYELQADETDGSYFIDRDGRHFHHVLNFLRGVESFECPTKPAELIELRKDALFYRLSGLVEIVDKKLAVSRGPVSLPTHLACFLLSHFPPSPSVSHPPPPPCCQKLTGGRVLQEAKLKEIGEGTGRAVARNDAARRSGFSSATEQAWAAASRPPTQRFS